MWCIVDRSPTQQTRPWGGAQQAMTFPNTFSVSVLPRIGKLRAEPINEDPKFFDLGGPTLPDPPVAPLPALVDCARPQYLGVTTRHVASNGVECDVVEMGESQIDLSLVRLTDEVRPIGAMLAICGVERAALQRPLLADEGVVQLAKKRPPSTDSTPRQSSHGQGQAGEADRKCHGVQARR